MLPKTQRYFICQYTAPNSVLHIHAEYLEYICIYKSTSRENDSRSTDIELTCHLKSINVNYLIESIFSITLSLSQYNRDRERIDF